MRLTIFTTIIMLGSVSLSYSMNELKNISYFPRGLLIFLDDAEKQIDAVSDSLITALYQEAGPIIASASLLVTIFSGATDQFKNEDPKELIKTFRRLRFQPIQGKAIKEERDIILRALAFNPRSWIIKKVNDSLYLLIPYSYLESLHIRIDPAEIINDSKEISDIELQLGLKINHMDTVNLEDITQRRVAEYRYADYFVEALYNIRTKTSGIFCTRSDYSQKGFFNQPLWSIYLTGHGTMGQSIIGLRLNSFKELLDFLEQKINCRLLMYRSCYAAGLNSEIIFKDAQSAVQKTYPFAIITQALTDAPTAGIKLDLELDGNRLKLETFENFANFFKEATRPEILNFEKVVTTIFPVLPGEELKFAFGQAWGNVPQIKLPGLEWFSVMASKKNIVALGSILSKTREPERPLNIVNFFKTDPKALLLYARDIPFELIIDSENLEAIISMIPGDAVHKIKKISSSQKNINKILNWFMAIKMLDSRKLFYIEAFNTIKDVIIYNNKVPGNKRFNVPDRYDGYAFFSDQGEVYMKESNGQIQIVDEDKRELYENLLGEVKGEIKELDTFTFKSNGTIRFPQLNRTTIIQKIEGEKGSKINFSDIFYALKMSLPLEGIVWVKEISGLYDRMDLSLSDVDVDEFITLNDVIVDRKDGIFFMYKNNFYHEKRKINEDYRNEYKERMMTSVPQSCPFPELTHENIRKINKMLAKQIKKGPLEEEEESEKSSYASKGKEKIRVRTKRQSFVQRPGAEKFKQSLIARDYQKDRELINKKIVVKESADDIIILLRRLENKLKLLHEILQRPDLRRTNPRATIRIPVKG